MNIRTELDQGEQMQVTTSNLIRWAGLSAMVAGIIFAGVLPLHPPIHTSAFLIITSIKPAMAIFGLLGITGLYARQVKETGWLGLVGYLLLTVYFALQMCLSFIEPVILPLLTTAAPAFVESALGIATGAVGPMNLDAFANAYSLASVMYVFGLLVFGIAMFRAHILPRPAVILFAISGPLAGILFALLPASLDVLTGLPTGIALVWLGYALLTEGHGKAAETRIAGRTGIAEPSKVA